MPLPLGKMRSRVTLQTLSENTDAIGGRTNQWTDGSTVWAAITPLSGRELAQARQVQSSVSHRVNIRYNADVTIGTRLKYGSRLLHVVGLVNTDNLGEELVLTCEEVTPNV